MIETLRELAGVAWGFRWAALAVFLYSTGQRVGWPYSLVQLVACVFMTALIAAGCAQLRVELARRLWPVPVLLRPEREDPPPLAGFTPGTITAGQVYLQAGVIGVRSPARGGER